MFCCVKSSLAIIPMGKRELVALLSLSSWCLVIVVCLYLTVSWVCLQFVIVVFPDQTQVLFYALLARSVINVYTCSLCLKLFFTASVNS